MTPRLRRSTVLTALFCAISAALLTGCAADGSTAAPSTASAAAPSPTGHVFTPTGLGPLRLGMTIAQAKATGMFPDGLLMDHPTGCASTTDPSNTYTIKYTAKDGVVLIAAEGVRTPEGIGSGATLAQVEATYTTSAEPELGSLAEQYRLFGDMYVVVSGNPAAEYDVMFRQGKVWYVFLRLKSAQGC